jgi:hypothetical protein
MGKKHIKTEQKKKCRLTKGQNYRLKCKEQGRGFNSSGIYSQVHHILCEHAIKDRVESYPQDATIISYIESCLALTEWSINNDDNLIGLPTNAQYILSNGTVPINYPAHNIDHTTDDGYSTEVTRWLQHNLWNTLEAKSEPHEADVQKIKDQLKQGTKHLLTNRGLRTYGTQMGWKLRHDKGYEKKWYQPFSMAKKPRHRHPGVDKSNLTQLFDMLG